MKKLFLATLCSMLALTGCGSSEGTTSNGQSGSEGKRK